MTINDRPETQVTEADAFEAARAQARCSYELGRARVGLLRGFLVAGIVALIAALTLAPSSIGLAAIVLVVVAVAEWRGDALASGVRVGLGGGLLALLAPESVLRPCCAARSGLAAMCNCGIASSGCWTAGALVGLLVGVLLPRARGGTRLESIGGGALAAVAVASVRCSGMFLGESVGLLAGITVGVAVVGVAARFLQSHPA
jgi:hypothetical protein